MPNERWDVATVVGVLVVPVVNNATPGMPTGSGIRVCSRLMFVRFGERIGVEYSGGKASGVESLLYHQHRFRLGTLSPRIKE